VSHFGYRPARNFSWPVFDLIDANEPNKRMLRNVCGAKKRLLTARISARELLFDACVVSNRFTVVNLSSQRLQKKEGYSSSKKKDAIATQILKKKTTINRFNACRF
jgi:hypothetical protein